jgi:hypothetical protein
MYSKIKSTKMKYYINEKKVKRLNKYLELIEEMSVEKLKQYNGKLIGTVEKDLNLLISVLMVWKLLIMDTLDRGYYLRENEEKTNLENMEKWYQQCKKI